MVKKRGKYFHYHFFEGGQEFRGSTKQTVATPAQRYESELRASIRSGNTYVTKRCPKLSEIADRFIAVIDASQLDSDTKKYYRNGWRLLQATDIKDMKLDSITRDEIQALRFPGSSSNSNNALRTLSRMLKWAEEKKMIPRSPRIKLDREYRRKLMLTEEHLQQITIQPLKDVAALVMDTGLRPWRELKYLRVENLNFQDRTIYNPDGKTLESQRIIPMSERAKDILVSWCAGRTSGFVFFDHAPGTWEFTSQVGIQFRKVRKDLGWPKKLVLYCARHTFGTEMMKRTKNVFAVMEVMGHTDIKTTQKYQHQGLEEITAAVRRVM